MISTRIKFESFYLKKPWVSIQKQSPIILQEKDFLLHEFWNDFISSENMISVALQNKDRSPFSTGVKLCVLQNYISWFLFSYKNV